MVAELRLRSEALQVAVARIGEPDRPVALDDDVVRRVERDAGPGIDERLHLSAAPVEARDAGRLLERPLLADDEPSLEVEGHAVGIVRVTANDPDCSVSEVETLDRDPLAPHCREVERVLARDINGSLVRIRLRDEGGLDGTLPDGRLVHAE
jgi:hypothetical protein